MTRDWKPYKNRKFIKRNRQQLLSLNCNKNNKYMIYYDSKL